MPAASQCAILSVLHTPILTLSPPLLSFTLRVVLFFSFSFIFCFRIWLSVFLPFCFSLQQWTVDNRVKWSPHNKMTSTVCSIRSTGFMAMHCFRKAADEVSSCFILKLSHSKYDTENKPTPITLSHMDITTYSYIESKLFVGVLWIIFGYM